MQDRERDSDYVKTRTRHSSAPQATLCVGSRGHPPLHCRKFHLNSNNDIPIDREIINIINRFPSPPSSWVDWFNESVRNQKITRTHDPSVRDHSMSQKSSRSQRGADKFPWIPSILCPGNYRRPSALPIFYDHFQIELKEVTAITISPALSIPRLIPFKVSIDHLKPLLSVPSARPRRRLCSTNLNDWSPWKSLTFLCPISRIKVRGLLYIMSDRSPVSRLFTH